MKRKNFLFERIQFLLKKNLCRGVRSKFEVRLLKTSASVEAKNPKISVATTFAGIVSLFVCPESLFISAGRRKLASLGDSGHFKGVFPPHYWPSGFFFWMSHSWLSFLFSFFFFNCIIFYFRLFYLFLFCFYFALVKFEVREYLPLVVCFYGRPSALPIATFLCFY